MRAHVGAYGARDINRAKVNCAHRYSGPKIEDRGGVLGTIGRRKPLKSSPLINAKILRNFFRVGITPLSTFSGDVAASGASHQIALIDTH